MLNQYHELPSLKIPSEFPCDMIDLILLVINSITCKLSVASKLDTLKTRVTSLILWNDLKKKNIHLRSRKHHCCSCAVITHLNLYLKCHNNLHYACSKKLHTTTMENRLKILHSTHC
jgi:hypothetical protein